MMRRPSRRVAQPFFSALAAIAIISFPSHPFAAELDWQRADDDRRLREAGIATDGKSLLQYLQSKTPTSATRERINRLIGQLGDRSFRTRREAAEQLAKAGEQAFAPLTEAKHSSDPEVAHRAEQILRIVGRKRELDLVPAAARLLAEAQPEGTVAALLSYLPWTHDEPEREVFLSALVKAGIREQKPISRIVQAVESDDPHARVAAAYVLGRVQPLPREALAELLSDPHVEVRYRAAKALVEAKEKTGVPTLIGLLSDATDDRCRRIEDLLFCLTDGEGKPPEALVRFDADSRKKAQADWRQWWSQRRDAIDLAKIDFLAPYRGLTLYCEYDGARGGRVWVADRGGKLLWEVTGLSGPNDARLLSRDRLLIAERNASRVTERDRTGKILWQKQLTDSAIAAERLKNGHTLITTWNSVLVVDQKGNQIWRYAKSMRYAYQLPNRHVLGIGSNGDVIELSPTGQLLKTVKPERDASGAGYWASVERLPNGRYLAALGSSKKIVEIDERGKIHWEATVPNAVYATRLRDGGTLVCNFEGRNVVKLDRGGREISKKTLSGRPFVVRQY